MSYIFLSFIVLISYLSSNNKLEQNIQNIINRLPKSANSSVYIFDASTGESIIEKNIGKSMIPASNTKLFTTAAALNIMGPDYEVVTKVLADSLANNGIIKGNLYIKGYGQSTFTTKNLDSLVSSIVSAGIKQIDGHIVGDDSYFDKLYTRDDWIINERANVKLPPVSALIVNKNQFVISLKSNGIVGSKLRYSIKPDCSFIKVEMQAKVKRKRSRLRIRSSFKGNIINVIISGSLKKRNTQRSYVVNIDNPPLYAALLLKEKLQQRGIKITGNAIVGVASNFATELASIGIKIDKLIALINKNSNNYLAECLFKTIGAFNSGLEGNSFYATQAVLSVFENDSIIDDATSVVDGSGISRFNTITTGSIGRLLNKLYKSEFLYEEFYRSLSISGIDGTLKERPINNFIKGNFHGKTGTLNGVTALSGYLTGKNNHTYIISMITQYKTRGSRFYKDIEDRVLLELSK